MERDPLDPLAPCPSEIVVTALIDLKSDMTIIKQQQESWNEVFERC
jgi:hypothetical protein